MVAPRMPSTSISHRRKTTCAAVPAAGGRSFDLNVPGATTTRDGNAYVVKFSDPVFVSADYISPEGMRALKALAGKLAAMPVGA